MAPNAVDKMEEALDIIAYIPLIGQFLLINGYNDFLYLIRAFYDNKLNNRFKYDNYLADLVYRFMELYKDKLAILGVRYITLAYNKNNRYIDSAVKLAYRGLSLVGKVMIKEINRIGMIINLFYTSKATIILTLENSAALVAFTYSSYYALVKNPRNVLEVVLDKLKENNSIIIISLIPPFTYSNTIVADINNIINYILYAAKKIGFNYIGLGLDYNSMFKAVSKDIKKVIGLNVIYILKEVKEVVRNIRGWLLWFENFRIFIRKEYL
ncbi:membrane dipeptidase-domain-containing protein [Cenococcum geophilum]